VAPDRGRRIRGAAARDSDPLAGNRTLIWGSPATTPSISPALSCSAAASEAPAPFDAEAAMTVVLPALNCTVFVVLPPPAARTAHQDVQRELDRLQREAAPVFLGFACECACLNA